MKSPKQAAANRRNALRSSGPKTEEGKRRSAVNATKHGLTMPIDASDWALHLPTIASLLMTDDGLGEAEAWELARRILDYERNLQHQRERFVESLKNGEPEPETASDGSYYFERARQIEEEFSYHNNYGGLGRNLTSKIVKIYLRWGTEDLKKHEHEPQPKFRAADRYLRRSSNQLIKQCRRLTTPPIEP